MIVPLMMLAGLALLVSQKKRAPATVAQSTLEQEAQRIVRESREIIDGKREAYSDPSEAP